MPSRTGSKSVRLQKLAKPSPTNGPDQRRRRLYLKALEPRTLDVAVFKPPAIDRPPSSLAMTGTATSTSAVMQGSYSRATRQGSYIYIYIYIEIYIYIYMYVCMYVCVYIYIYML